MTPLRIYVGGGSTERARARDVIDRISAIPGVEITFDWVAHMEASGAPDSQLPQSVLAESARLDLDGVRRAEVFVALAPQSISAGMQSELGAALAYGTLVLMCRTPWSAPVGIFGELADITLPSDDEVLAWISGYARARADREDGAR